MLLYLSVFEYFGAVTDVKKAQVSVLVRVDEHFDASIQKNVADFHILRFYFDSPHEFIQLFIQLDQVFLENRYVTASLIQK